MVTCLAGLLAGGLVPRLVHGEAAYLTITNLAVQAQPDGSALYRVCVLSSATPLTGHITVRDFGSGSDVSIPLTPSGVDCNVPNSFLLTGSYRASAGQDRTTQYHFQEVFVEVPGVVAESVLAQQALLAGQSGIPIEFDCSVDFFVDSSGNATSPTTLEGCRTSIGDLAGGQAIATATPAVACGVAGTATVDATMTGASTATTSTPTTTGTPTASLTVAPSSTNTAPPTPTGTPTSTYPPYLLGGSTRVAASPTSIIPPLHHAASLRAPAGEAAASVATVAATAQCTATSVPATATSGPPMATATVSDTMVTPPMTPSGANNTATPTVAATFASATSVAATATGTTTAATATGTSVTGAPTTAAATGTSVVATATSTSVAATGTPTAPTIVVVSPPGVIVVTSPPSATPNALTLLGALLRGTATPSPYVARTAGTTGPRLNLNVSPRLLRPGDTFAVTVRYIKWSLVRAALGYTPHQELTVTGRADSKGALTLHMRVPIVALHNGHGIATLSVVATSGTHKAMTATRLILSR